MADDDTKDYATRTLDDEQEDTVDVSDTDLDTIADGVMDTHDEPLEDDEITFSELGEEDEDTDEENNVVENLLPNIDEGTE